MEISEGYFYHVKDEFFAEVQDSSLMMNKEDGGYRPHYFAIRDTENNGIYWMIPVSSKYDKYQKIVDKQILRYGNCTKIVLGECDGKDAAFLIQNAFPLIDSYLDHVHTSNGKPLKLHEGTGKVITENLINNLKLKKHGVKLFYSDIDRIYAMMLLKLKHTETETLVTSQ